MKDPKQAQIRGIFLIVLIIANAVVLRNGFTENNKWYWALLFTVPMLAIILLDNRVKNQEKILLNKLHSKSNKNHAKNKKQIDACKR